MATTDSATEHRGRPRADALRNRERIVAAAREVFVDQGPHAPLDEIARRAGVGNATLYRHFPDRETLVHHVVRYVNERITERAQRVLTEEPDPFEALRRLILDSADERIGALCPLLGVAIDPQEPDLVASRERMLAVTEQVLDRAHRSGQLRTDIGAGDLLVAVSRLTRPVPGTSCTGGEALARRHLQIFLDGLRTPARSELPGEPAGVAELEESLVC